MTSINSRHTVDRTARTSSSFFTNKEYSYQRLIYCALHFLAYFILIVNLLIGWYFWGDITLDESAPLGIEFSGAIVSYMFFLVGLVIWSVLSAIALIIQNTAERNL